MDPVRSSTGAVVRFVASVLLVSGALLVADALATLLWQEPLSALLAARDQAALARALDSPHAGPGPALSRPRLAALARSERRRLSDGEAVGRVVLPTLRRSYVVVEGTATDDLRRGPGHYPGTPLPGAGGTAAVAGHRTTYGAPFRHVDRLSPGDAVEMAMPYARLRYRVEDVRIVPPNAWWVVESRGYDRLVLTACHPLYSAAQRVVVFARLERASAPVRASRPAFRAGESTRAQPRSPAGARPSGT